MDGGRAPGPSPGSGNAVVAEETGDVEHRLPGLRHVEDALYRGSNVLIKFQLGVPRSVAEESGDLYRNLMHQDDSPLPCWESTRLLEGRFIRWVDQSTPTRSSLVRARP